MLAIASTITQPVTSRPDKHASAATRARPATITPQPGHPRSVPPNPPHAVATAVAHAYARYLAGQLPAQRLPALTPQALAIARQSGPLPARLDVTQVRLTSLNRDGNSWTASYAITDARGRQTTTAQLLLTTSGSRWVVAELVQPDLDTLITPNPPALPATGPPAVRHAALAFTQSYLAYTYGHATASQLRDLTQRCEPRSPPTHPKCQPPSAHSTPGSRPSHSPNKPHTGWRTRTSPTDKTPTS